MESEEKTWLEALLEQDKDNEDLHRQVWKARHQRHLTDEEIAYFLKNCSRWDMLTYYACYFRKAKDMRKALECLRQDFSLDAGPQLVDWYWTEDGDPERCSKETVCSRVTLRCDHCNCLIPTGAVCAKLTSLEDGDVYYLHDSCARKGTQIIRKD